MNTNLKLHYEDGTTLTLFRCKICKENRTTLNTKICNICNNKIMEELLK